MMLHIRPLWIAIFFSLLGINLPAAETQLTILEVIDVSLLVQHSLSGFNYALAPDGFTMAWAEADNLCLFTFLVKETTCHTTPEWPDYIVWSPNSQYILLVNRSGYAPSFQVYEPATGDYTNFPGNYYLSYPAVRDASGHKLYFLSYDDLSAKNNITLLHEYSMLTGQDRVTDLSTIFQDDFADNRLVAISAAGNQIVIRADHTTSTVPAAGLWLIDIQQQRITEFASLHNLPVGLPDWYSVTDLQIEDTYWNRQTNQILVSIGRAMPPYTVTISAIDWETRLLTPLLDYRNTVGSADTLLSLAYYETYITPDGEFLFYIKASDDTSYSSRIPIYVLPFSTDPREPLLVTDAYDFECGGKTLLVTLQDKTEIKRYLYRFFKFCPG